MSYLVFSTSLNPNSQSRLLARYAHTLLSEAGHEAEIIDLQEYEVPFCDGGQCYGHEHVQTLQKKVEAAKGILLATPVYNYTVCASAKNLIELTGQQWRGKVVGLMCAAGGQGSYMALMGIANSLMLDFRCIIIPRFVYAMENAFRGEEVTDEAVQQRLAELTTMLNKLSRAVNED